MSDQMRKQAIVLSSRESYAKTQAPGNVVLSWVVHNQNKKQWEEGAVLKNHCSDDAYVKPLYTKSRLGANEIREV